MRLVILVAALALAGCSKKDHAVTAEPARADDAPAATASDASSPDATAVDAATRDAGPSTYRVHPASGGWLPALPHEKGFRSLAMADAGTVRVTWDVGAARHVRDAWPDVSRVTLRVERGAASETVDFGEVSGGFVPSGISACMRRGFTTPATISWQFPTIDGMVAAMSLGVAQGTDDFMVMRGPNALYVLHRQTSDGKCDDIKQGPLEGCAGFEWRTRLVIDAPGDPDFEENVVSRDPFDCAAHSMAGVPLVPP